MRIRKKNIYSVNQIEVELLSYFNETSQYSFHCHKSGRTRSDHFHMAAMGKSEN